MTDECCEKWKACSIRVDNLLSELTQVRCDLAIARDLLAEEQKHAAEGWAMADELRTQLEGHLVFGRIDGSYRCKDCFAVAQGGPPAGWPPKPYPHDEQCIIKRTTPSEGTDGG